MKQTTSTATIRKKNTLNILRAIIDNGIISRPELAKLTDLTLMTITNLTADLEKMGIVLRQGKQPSKGGRKAVLYRLNATHRLIIGVSLQIKRATIELFNLCGKKVYDSISIDLGSQESVNESIDTLSRALQNLITNSGNKKGDILAIGISVPGQVDPRRGTIYGLTNMPDWRDIPLKSMLEKKLNIPVFLERDTNAHAICLMLSNDIKVADNFVYMAIDEGIGGGIVIDNGVYHGSHGIAGEIGHISVDINGRKCNCGGRGCLEVYTSHNAIINTYIDLSNGGDPQAVKAINNPPQESKYIIDLAKRASTGDAIADSAFLKTLPYLSASIMNTIKSYNPSTIVIECSWMRQNRRYFDMLIDAVFTQCRLLDKSDLDITLNPLLDIFSISTYMLVLERVLTDINDNLLIK